MIAMTENAPSDLDGMDRRIMAALAAERITQLELAALLGISRPAVSDRMRGRSRWSLAEVVALADRLGVSVDYLVGRANPPIGYMTTDLAVVRGGVFGP